MVATPQVAVGMRKCNGNNYIVVSFKHSFNCSSSISLTWAGGPAPASLRITSYNWASEVSTNPQLIASSVHPLMGLVIPTVQSLELFHFRCYPCL